jgi:glycosyltransferase involved in cell wall biosynthesis
MRVLIIATSAEGGAGVAAFRSFEALKQANVDVSFISNEKSIISPTSHLSNRPARLHKFLRRSNTYIQRKWIQRGIEPITSLSVNTISSLYKDYEKEFDVIHIHASYNFVTINEIRKLEKKRKKVFITLHDQRFFTGGCHYSGLCAEFKRDCHRCPQINPIFKNLARRTLLQSRVKLSEMNSIHFISPSSWLMEVALSSSLMSKARISVVRNPVPDVFFISEKNEKSISENEIRIGFIAQDLRNAFKGFAFFRDALSELNEKTLIDFKVVIACNEGRGEIPEWMSAIYVSPKNNVELISFYKTLDILVVPSQQDNSPNVIVEALATGTRIIGTNSGGIPELLRLCNQPVVESDSLEDLVRALQPSAIAQIETPDPKTVKDNFCYQAYAEQMVHLYSE